jgi:hypothetical protein
MEPIRTPVEKFTVALLEADSLPGLQEEINLYTDRQEKDNINYIVVNTTLNSWYDQDKKCMIYGAAVLGKFVF